VQNQIKNTALITGGSRGIGAGIALALAKHGYNLIIADIQPISIELKKVFENHGIEVYFIQADVSLTNDRGSIVDFCKNTVSRLDLLVNNAGISVKKRQDMLEGEEDSFDMLLNINLKGPYFLTQSISKWMIEQRKNYPENHVPKIINIASLTSYASSTYMAEYALSKAAVSMMTKLYADRLSEYNIPVFEIRPGIIETEMTKPAKDKYDKFINEGGLLIARWGLPEDIGKAVVAIASNLLPYSTGEVINVDGGFHLRRL
jgi:NAD(P)-dependent dehydrogenase (short-subunit alcohol dehydrogenase family)